MQRFKDMLLSEDEETLVDKTPTKQRRTTLLSFEHLYTTYAKSLLCRSLSGSGSGRLVERPSCCSSSIRLTSLSMKLKLNASLVSRSKFRRATLLTAALLDLEEQREMLRKQNVKRTGRREREAASAPPLTQTSHDPPPSLDPLSNIC